MLSKNDMFYELLDVLSSDCGSCCVCPFKGKNCVNKFYAHKILELGYSKIPFQPFVVLSLEEYQRYKDSFDLNKE